MSIDEYYTGINLTPTPLPRKRDQGLSKERGQFRAAKLGVRSEDRSQRSEDRSQNAVGNEQKAGIKLHGIRNIWVIIAIVLLHNCVHPQENVVPGKQVITSDEIKAAGIINLSDLFSLFDKWNYSSIDGFNHIASANSLSGYQFQNFIIMVDGQRIDLSFLNTQNINMLPFTPEQISYIEVINSPQLYEGEFSSSGLIHFHLKRPAKNLTTQFNYATGNETGDPGPYKFTQFESPNLDKINYLMAADFNYASKNWFLRSSVKQEENFVSDERIKKRILSFSLNSDKAQSIASFGEVRVNLKQSSHNLFASYTTSNDYFYFKPMGNELPVRKVLLHAGLSGRFIISPNINLNYNLAGSQNRFIDWQSINIDFRKENINASMFSEFKSSRINLLFGLGYDRNLAYTGVKLSDKTISFKKLFTRILFNPSDKLNYTADGIIIEGESELSVKSSISSTLKFNTHNSISGLFSYSETSLDELQNYWTWFFRGFSFDVKTPVNYTIPSYLGKNNLVTAELIHTFNFDTTFNTEAGLFYRQIRTYLEKQNFQLKNNYFVSAVELVPDTQIKTIGFHIGFRQKIITGLDYKINYYFQKVTSADELYKKEWAALPAHNVSLVINFKPANSFGIWTRLNYLSRTKWEEFNYFEYQAQEGFSNEVNRGIILDLSIQKYFGNNLIWTNLLFKNILNQKEFYHPAGANFNLRFYFQVRINLDNLPE